MSQHIIQSPGKSKKANLDNYDLFREKFRWEQVRHKLDGLPGGGLNLAYEAVDRHVQHGHGETIAIRWLGKKGGQIDLTYQDLSIQSNRFANVLDMLKLQKADRIFVLTGRIPELYITALGTWKYGATFCPLFSAFGPEPVYQRLDIGGGKVIVTTKAYYKNKVKPSWDKLPNLEYVILTDVEENVDDRILSWKWLMSDASDNYHIPETGEEDMAILHFTSGTTGKPKGAIHVHKAVFVHYMTGKYVLDMHPGDIYWCTADPGWVTGTSYGILAPLVHGITNIIDEKDFDAERWYTILEEQKVNIWYTAPTAIRMLMRVGIEPLEHYDLSNLRLVYSVGEPLNPEAVHWGRDHLDLTINDNWWQTETGGIMISNYASMPVKPGSMGKPIPGIEAAIINKTGSDKVEIIKDSDVVGQLALKPGWPSMFRGYLHNEDRYNASFVDGWYVSGDLARKDADGYFWFVGRADDIIKTAGHMVGPFEVESVLMEHDAVAEVGVIGVPDPVIGEMVKAFIVLHDGFEPTEDLKLSLTGLARKRLGSAVAPKEIEFKENLPKTRSGKVMRRLLKARELGEDEGDTSTLESES